MYVLGRLDLEQRCDGVQALQRHGVVGGKGVGKANGAGAAPEATWAGEAGVAGAVLHVTVPFSIPPSFVRLVVTCLCRPVSRSLRALTFVWLCLLRGPVSKGAAPCPGW